MRQPWSTRETAPNEYYIMDGDRIVGSIVLKGERWRVEVLWAGDDILGDFSDYLQALAFVEGVDKTFVATRNAAR